jgi:dolichol-phosphate mannosyltransferase
LPRQGNNTVSEAAMRYAIDHGYDFLVNMDADFSHHPRYLPAIVAGMTSFDIMIGSRYVRGGAAVNWPPSRRLISRSFNALV